MVRQKIVWGRRGSERQLDGGWWSGEGGVRSCRAMREARPRRAVYFDLFERVCCLLSLVLAKKLSRSRSARFEVKGSFGSGGAAAQRDGAFSTKITSKKPYLKQSKDVTRVVVRRVSMRVQRNLGSVHSEVKEITTRDKPSTNSTISQVRARSPDRLL